MTARAHSWLLSRGSLCSVQLVVSATHLLPILAADGGVQCASAGRLWSQGGCEAAARERDGAALDFRPLSSLQRAQGCSCATPDGASAGTCAAMAGQTARTSVTRATAVSPAVAGPSLP